MTKRRRERDRPKSGPESIYNPNKRVLLSYGSDEEQDDDDVEQPTGTGHPGAVDANVADYQIPSYDEEDDGPADQVADETAAAVNGSPEPVAQQEKGRSNRNVRRNELTGQMPAIGSLSYQWEEDEDGEIDDDYDSIEEEAMAYLRAVRSERQTLPTILTAPQGTDNAELYEGGLGDTKGHLADGTFIAQPAGGPSIPDTAEAAIDAQEAYTKVLKQRFVKQREEMRRPPNQGAIASLDDDHPITCPAHSPKARAEWTRLLTSTSPQTAQVKAMDRDTVYSILSIVQESHLKRNTEIATCTGAWIWALISRLDDVGTMDNDQVSSLRELGKKAVLVQLSFRDSDAAQQLEAVGADEKKMAPNERNPKSEDDPAKPASSNNGNGVVEGHPEADVNPGRETTLATLDMIISIVGDVFGQRDLLEFRSRWQPEEVTSGIEAS
ncbi:hypothetical protein D0869_11746 [Hortaea werneckii]|uniref:Uncharacterized protein n=2 Tax=Hortaea werneckii TaxID=91943 RepID=A0A3M6XWG1_HORWE|nr:hypothetical protein KC324_g4207 [Hortaea werneckii]KAI7591536.1 hypothetical protein KC316_g2820 [Hortaea werneckii]RMX75304.1 hypothetical protein D0869_11746 [Hortaea werneckii]RMX95137.1 hypothetical protein D0868_11901 [Hortaea werneckii]RMY38148.1 hypothetical protein D0866_02810 [Hortaea werneckii]